MCHALYAYMTTPTACEWGLVLPILQQSFTVKTHFLYSNKLENLAKLNIDMFDFTII